MHLMAECTRTFAPFKWTAACLGWRLLEFQTALECLLSIAAYCSVVGAFSVDHFAVEFRVVCFGDASLLSHCQSPSVTLWIL